MSSMIEFWDWCVIPILKYLNVPECEKNIIKLYGF